MTLFAFTHLITSALLLGLGALFLVSNSAIVSTLKAFPRSKVATIVFFGGGSAWFLYNVAHMSTADVIGFATPQPFVLIFGALALLSFIFLPEFLAVRGLSILILVGAWPLLMAMYGMYEVPARLFLVSFLYLAVIVALVLAMQPYRLRDFFDWLFRAPGRSRAFGAALAAYGLLLAGIAFTR